MAAMLHGELSAAKTAAELVDYMTSQAQEKPPPAIEEHGGQPAAQKVAEHPAEKAAQMAALLAANGPSEEQPLSGVAAWAMSGKSSAGEYQEGPNLSVGGGSVKSRGSLRGSLASARSSIRSNMSSASKAIRDRVIQPIAEALPNLEVVPKDGIRAMLFGLRRLPQEVQDSLNFSGPVFDHLAYGRFTSHGLRAACVKHEPTLYRSAVGTTIIEPEEALLSYHQIRHEIAVFECKAEVAGERKKLERLLKPPKAPQGQVESQVQRYETALNGLVDLGLIDFRLKRLDTLVGELVESATKRWEDTDKRDRGRRPMTLGKARWQVRVFVEQNVPGSSFLRLETDYGATETQEMKELQTKCINSEKEYQQGKSGDRALVSSRTKLYHASADAKSRLSGRESAVGIKITELDHLVDQIIMTEDATVRAHMLAWPALREELAQPEVAACIGHTQSESGIDNEELSAKALDHLLRGSGVLEAQAEQARKVKEVVTGSTAAVISETWLSGGITGIPARTVLGMHFRGDERDTMAARCETLGLGQLVHLLSSFNHEIMGKARVSGFPEHLSAVFRSAIAAAEKDPDFLKKLHSVWTPAHSDAANHTLYFENTLTERTYPAVAQHAVHRLEMMVRAQDMAQGKYDKDPETLAKETLAQFRFALLPRSLLVGVGQKEQNGWYGRGKANAIRPQKYSENFGDPQGLPVLADELHTEQPLLGHLTHVILRAEHDISAALGLGLVQHFDYKPLVERKAVKFDKKTKNPEANEQALMDHHRQHASQSVKVKEILEQDIANTLAALLGTTVETFMDWAAQWPPFQAAFRRIQPSAYEMKDAKSAGDKGDDQGLVKMDIAYQARSAAGELLKAQGIFKALNIDAKTAGT
jgi:hypothetical protein